MPFGRKPDVGGSLVDFDAVYRELIAPAIEAAGTEPLRADEEMTGGIIHKPMFERLIPCEYAVADLTTANADVFYELGVRHAVRPFSTVLLFAEGGSRLPFDVRPLRAMPYRLTADGRPAHEAGVVIDLFVSYRAVKAWNAMIALAQRMSPAVAATALVREQLALALNRAGCGEEAEQVLLDLIQKRGPSSETYGILGRVYKDRWEAAARAGERFLAHGLLDKAIHAYLQGFEADWRDAYPRIDAVTLMELKDPPDPRRIELVPIVTYAVERRIAAAKPDYWDHATRLELAVLGKDEAKAMAALAAALPAIREVWEPETTARNLRLIREARARRGEDLAWADELEAELDRQARKQ